MNDGFSLFTFGLGLCFGDYGRSVITIGGMMILFTGMITMIIENEIEKKSKKGERR